MRSLDRVLARHRAALEFEALEELPPMLRALDPTAAIENEVDRLARWVGFEAGDGQMEWLELRSLSIYEVVERYPDVDIGW